MHHLSTLASLGER